jgi:hypothetical protein
VGWWWVLGSLQPVDERVDAGGESLVAVVEPDVLAEGDQGGEPVTGKRSEEFVESFSGRRVLDTLFVDGDAGAADLKSDGVVGDEEERETGFAVGKSGVVQWQQESFGQGEGVRPEGVASFQQAGDPGMIFRSR